MKILTINTNIYFKVFMSCVLGYILLILTQKKRKIRIEKIYRQKMTLTRTTTKKTVAS